MLLYALLHLTGYDLPLTELMNFRQWGSQTPGHPEHGDTPGVETTTGPLGQGAANAVGMALAEAFLASHFNRAGFPLVDHRTYALVSDGDLQEGVCMEASALAGLWGLGKLTFLYDSNEIQLDGPTDMVWREDVLQRFQAIGWHVIAVADGNDAQQVSAALAEAQQVTDRPTLIAVRTTIGFGSPNKAGTSDAHGSPLGADEVRSDEAGARLARRGLLHSGRSAGALPRGHQPRRATGKRLASPAGALGRGASGPGAGVGTAAERRAARGLGQ